ncbi:MAG: ADP-ribosylation factor-directed GTPase activating protein isoform b [Rubripirellula sp.]|nr:ADP-ribosylation factor-directed GTPase activating protein isoform b [Rubripirellula sp.]
MSNLQGMRAAPALLIVSSLLCLGCPLAGNPSLPPAANSQSEEPIADLVQRTLDQNRVQRRLAVQTHGAWQILHGILAYGDQFTLETANGPQIAIDYLLQGKPVAGFEPNRGDRLGDPPRFGLRMEMQPSTKIGQGHRDQWLAVLSQSGLTPETKIGLAEPAMTIEDWVRQVEYDLPRNLELEFSWTLIALTQYRDTNHQWTARDGNSYSIEDLVQSEVNQSIPSSVCGGTHRLIGIAAALSKRRAEGRPITGVWADAEMVLANAVENARQNQNPDGSYGVDYLHRPGWTRDLGESLGTTGHVLEFIALSAPDRMLNEPWVERTARRLCGILQQCETVDLECGVLYHALHGLQEYQSRRQAYQSRMNPDLTNSAS